MNKIFIYALKEKDGKIRYVGKSNDPKKRLSSHLRSKEKNYKTNWIKHCKNNNIQIEMIILEECDYDNWKEREIFWITQFKNLTNYDRGGQGGAPIRFHMSYEDCKIWVKNNLPQINSSSKWIKNKINLPDFISPYPNATYLHRGWISWGDFLNTGFIHYGINSKNYITYNEAKLWCYENNIKNMKEYSQKFDRKFLPPQPKIFYKEKGWLSFEDFFNISHYMRSSKTKISYSELKYWCELNKIKTRNDYTIKRLENFPTTPESFFKNEWKSWYIFLNKEKSKLYLSYEEIRELNLNNNLLNFSQYEKYRKKNKIDNIPHGNYVEKYYLNKGWVSASDFFNSEYKNFLRMDDVPIYEEAKLWCLQNKIKKAYDYFNNRPNNFPSSPERFYKNKGWVNWYDFLGKHNPK